MTYTTTEEFDVLHALRVRGLCAAEPLAESAGLSEDAVRAVLDAAVAGGLANQRSGRVEGYLLTGAGRERHAELHAHEVSAAQREALAPAYAAFLEPNRRFKTLTTTWQTEGGGEPAALLDDLRAVHGELAEVLASAAGAVPRMRSYRPRFDAALERFAAGDADALVKPMSGSYHDVWMELHEDLLVTLGRERDEADG
jgi:hypothetical protein